VTVDGRKIEASQKSNPDLFWAIRGGGVAPFEMNPFTETSRGSKLVCVLNSRFINVQAHNPATHCLRYV
jgi:hypothetical protein